MHAHPPARGATPGAPFTPQPDPILCPRTPSSYEIRSGTPAQLAGHLAAQGWHIEPARSAHERLRLRHPGGAIVVVYAESVLVQGARPALGHAALAELVEEVQP